MKAIILRVGAVEGAVGKTISRWHPAHSRCTVSHDAIDALMHDIVGRKAPRVVMRERIGCAWRELLERQGVSHGR